MKQDSPDNNDNSGVFHDTCISELPTQASFEVAAHTVIQVPDLNSEGRDDIEADSDEPPIKRVYAENTGNGSSGISKLVEFCSKDIKYALFSVMYVLYITFAIARSVLPPVIKTCSNEATLSKMLARCDFRQY